MQRVAECAVAPPATVLLEHLRACDSNALDCRDAMVVAAHPDDETIALGGQLPRMRGVRVLHVTDGAPVSMGDALACGFACREDYADARRRELTVAMMLAGVGPERLLCLDVPDQAAALNLSQIAVQLAAIFRTEGVQTVLTHDFEGGHPDHDATAFAVHAACHLLQQDAPLVLEFPLYHARGERMELQAFTDAHSDVPECVLRLHPMAAERKRRMLSAFLTQRRTLAAFTVADERIRTASKRDFRELPNRGDVFYGRFGWGIRPVDWPGMVECANRELGLPQWL